MANCELRIATCNCILAILPSTRGKIFFYFPNLRIIRWQKDRTQNKVTYVKVHTGLGGIVDDIINGLVHGGQVEAGLIPMEVGVGRDVRFDVRDGSHVAFGCGVMPRRKRISNVCQVPNDSM